MSGSGDEHIRVEQASIANRDGGIVHAETVGRSACFQILQRFTQSTPNEHRADARMRTGSASVSEMEPYCRWFAITSHYSRAFKRQSGVTHTIQASPSAAKGLKLTDKDQAVCVTEHFHRPRKCRATIR